MMKRYTVTDGKLMLTLEEADDGWLVVTSPIDPGLTTQARSITEAFENARDALAQLRAYRADQRKALRSTSRRRKQLV
jgi:predicted RNase H-like HicB family nuclease